MDCAILQASLEMAIAEGWHCERVDDRQFVVAAPVTYSDGDHPELLVTLGDGGVITMSDFGAVGMRLSMADVPPSHGRAAALVRQTATEYGVHFDQDGELRLTLVDEALADGPRGQFGRALMRLSSAMLQIDALRALRATPKEPLFGTQLVNTLVADPRLPVTRRHRVQGATGKHYHVTAAVRVGAKDMVLVQAIARATATDMRNIDHTFRTFSDVNGSFSADRKVAVLPDDPKMYDPSDLRLLTRVSVVASWAQRTRLIDHLVRPEPVEGNKLYEDDPELFSIT
jgi:hypothetical protein